VIDRLSGWTIDRVAFARRRYQRAAGVEGPSSRRLAASFMERLGQQQAYGQETMDVDAAQRLAAISAWVYSDISLIAGRLAGDTARPVAAQYVDGSWREDWTHPMSRILGRPNALMSGSYMLRYVAWWYLLSGNAYVFVSTDRVGGGEPLELWPLVSNQVTPLPETLRTGPRGLVVDYEYNVNGALETLPGEHVIHFRTANPWDYWRGLAPLTAGLLAVQADNARARWDRDFFGQDNAIPAAVISLPADITDSDFDRAAEEIRAEFGGRRRTAITRAGDLTVQTVQQTMADMQVIESRELSRREIDRVFGVPEGMFDGSTSGENRLALESTFATNTVQPLIEYFAEEWTRGLAWFYGEEGLTAYARTVVPRDRALAVQEYTIYGQDRTVNENREEQGLPRLADPLADVPVRLLGQYGKDAPGVGSMAGADAPENVAVAATEKALRGEAEPWRRHRARAERLLARAFREGHRDGGVIRRIAEEEVLPEAAFDPVWVQDYQARLGAKMTPALSVAARIAARAAAGQVGVRWDLVNEAAQRWAAARSYELIVGLTRTTEVLVQDAISRWIASGEPLEPLARQLTEAFGSQKRAEMVAATEVTRTFQQANETAWRRANEELDAGIVGGEWRTAVDELVCEICGPLDGATRSLNSPGYLHPETDELYLMPAHPRCRCWEAPMLSRPGSRQQGPGRVEVGD